MKIDTDILSLELKSATAALDSLSNKFEISDLRTNLKKIDYIRDRLDNITELITDLDKELGESIIKELNPTPKHSNIAYEITFDKIEMAFDRLNKRYASKNNPYFIREMRDEINYILNNTNLNDDMLRAVCDWINEIWGWDTNIILETLDGGDFERAKEMAHSLINNTKDWNLR